MERVKVDKTKEFFSKVLGKRSLRQLSKEIKVNYNTLKQWARGEILMPMNIFSELSKTLKEHERPKKIEVKDGNLGAKKGGRSSVKKLPKKEIYDRLKFARSHRKHVKEINLNLIKIFMNFMVH